MEIEAGFCADMFDPLLSLGSEPIKSQRIAVRVNFPNQTRAQGRPLGWINFAFEHRILHALTKVEAGSGDAA